MSVSFYIELEAFLFPNAVLPKGAGVKSLDFEAESKDFEVKSLDLNAESLDFEMKFLALNVESKDFEAESKDCEV